MQLEKTQFNMARKCFISFKKEDEKYKIEIQRNPVVDILDYSLNEAIDSEDEEYIIRKLREDYISKCTVLIHLIGEKSAEIFGFDEQKYIKRELMAALYDGEENTKSGILGIVLPSMYSRIFKESITCTRCGNSHRCVAIDGNTTIKEFHYNYYIPQEGKCSWSEDDRYCILVKWDDFIAAPNDFIESAFEKRTMPISSKTKVRV
jgi:hypothetical protein